jgi:hypothetical protein
MFRTFIGGGLIRSRGALLNPRLMLPGNSLRGGPSGRPFF